MRNVSVQELEANTAGLISELEAGHRLTLVRGGKAIADIIPRELPADITSTDKARAVVGQELIAILHEGFDMGGFKIANRDELYDRD